MPRSLELASAYVRLMLRGQPLPANSLLEGTGLDMQSLATRDFVDCREAGALLRNYDRMMQDETWAARLGARLSIGAHGPLGFAALSAPTLGEAMDILAALFASRTTMLSAFTEVREGVYFLGLRDETGDEDLARWMMQITLKIAETLLAAILGHPVSHNVRIDFRHDPQDPGALRGCYDASVTFGTAQDGITLPLAWRQLPSPLYDEPVYRANVIRCREAIANRHRGDSTAEEVRLRLRNHFDAQAPLRGACAPPPTLEAMAATLHVTPRTLIRRLRREHCNYRDILEGLRREYAERLLRDARLKVTDVAEILGYGETANFGRAFRRWYGESPGNWRRR